MTEVNKNNFCIIMAGGFGSRFWPMSKANNPKQFVDVMGTGESMLQNTFHRFERICPRENIIIVTGQLYEERVRQQIPGLKRYQVLTEPTRRNTAPCVAYAASIINTLNPHANIVVTPSDHAVFGEDAFVENITQALQFVAQNPWIITIGARPVNPNTKYGYIQFQESYPVPDAPNLHKVVTFTEKPPIEMAQQFIASGEFFWNAGIFVWSLPTLLQAYRNYLPAIANAFFALTPDTPAVELDRVYSLCESISVDFGIMEKAANVYVMEATFGWSDVETWDSLYGTCTKDDNGNAIVSGNVFAYEVKNCVVHVPSTKTVVLQGMEDYIVAGDEDTLLICRRDQEHRTFKFSSDVDLQQIMKVKSEK